MVQKRPTPNPAGKQVIQLSLAMKASMLRLEAIISTVKQISDLKTAQKLIDEEIVRLQKHLDKLTGRATNKATMAGVLRVKHGAVRAGVEFKRMKRKQLNKLLLANQREMLRDYKLVTSDLAKRLDSLILNGVSKRQLTSTFTRQLETALGQKATQTDILKAVLEENLKLIDSAGRQWDPLSYAKMVARTRTREYMSAGLEAQMKNNDFELYQVTDYGGEVDEDCMEIAGNVYRYGWATSKEAKQYPIAPFRVPVHPNCKHTETPFFVS